MIHVLEIFVLLVGLYFFCIFALLVIQRMQNNKTSKKKNNLFLLVVLTILIGSAILGHNAKAWNPITTEWGGTNFTYQKDGSTDLTIHVIQDIYDPTAYGQIGIWSNDYSTHTCGTIYTDDYLNSYFHTDTLNFPTDSTPIDEIDWTYATTNDVDGDGCLNGTYVFNQIYGDLAGDHTQGIHSSSVTTVTTTATSTINMLVQDDPTRNLFYAIILFYLTVLSLFFMFIKFKKKGGD